MCKRIANTAYCDFHTIVPMKQLQPTMYRTRLIREKARWTAAVTDAQQQVRRHARSPRSTTAGDTKLIKLVNGFGGLQSAIWLVKREASDGAE